MDFKNYKKILEEKSQLKNIIYNNGKKFIYQKNETILLGGNSIQYVYYLDKGRVKYTRLSEDGTNLILATKNKDIFIGAIPILHGSNVQNATVISETISEVYAIDLDTFFSLINSSMIFRYYLLKDVSYSMMYESKKNIASKLYTNKDILYSYLVDNIDYGQLIEGCWYNIYPQYSQQEYADFLGVSRMTISTITKNLCEEGKVRLINHELQVRICSEDILELN